jgi:hypothetical protein
VVVVNRIVVALFCCALVGELCWLAHRAHQLNVRVESMRADTREELDGLHQGVLMVRADIEDLQVRVSAVEDATDGGGSP